MGAKQGLSGPSRRVAKSSEPAESAVEPTCDVCRRRLHNQGLSAWRGRLALTLASIATGLAAVGYDRYGSAGAPGVLSLAALIFLVLPCAGWAFLELPTRFEAPHERRNPLLDEAKRWLRDSVLFLGVLCAVVALVQLPVTANHAFRAPVAALPPALSTTSTVTPPATADPAPPTTASVPTTIGANLATGATSTTLFASGTAAGRRRSIETLLRLILAVPLGGLILKMLLLRRYSSAARAKQGDYSLDLLLPTQDGDLKRLAQAITSHPASEPARVVKFEGRWGEGKSFILRRLANVLGEHVAVVHVDVWKHQAEPDLHLAIFEELLSTRCYLQDGGWLHIPVSVLPGRYLAGALATLSVKSGPAGVDLPIKLPRLAWQRQLERLVGRQRRKGRRTVFVLDEIDRAAPPMVQTAITLGLRSLDLAGVVVVMSYVEDIIRFKAFNPSVQPALADLGSSMEALIFVEQFDRDSALLGDSAVTGSLEEWWPTEVLRRATADPQSGSVQSDASKRDEARGADGLSQRLRLGFEGADRRSRLVLQGRFDERYLARTGVRVSPLTLADVATVPLRLQSLRRTALELAGYDPERVDDPPGLEAQILAALEALLRAPGRRASTDDPPPIRVLEGELGSMLAAAFQKLAAARTVAELQLEEAQAVLASTEARTDVTQTELEAAKTRVADAQRLGGAYHGDPALLCACVQAAFHAALARSTP